MEVEGDCVLDGWRRYFRVWGVEGVDALNRVAVEEVEVDGLEGPPLGQMHHRSFLR